MLTVLRNSLSEIHNIFSLQKVKIKTTTHTHKHTQQQRCSSGRNKTNTMELSFQTKWKTGEHFIWCSKETGMPPAISISRLANRCALFHAIHCDHHHFTKAPVPLNLGTYPWFSQKVFSLLATTLRIFFKEWSLSLLTRKVPCWEPRGLKRTGLTMNNTCLPDHTDLFCHDFITQLSKCASDTLYGCLLYSLKQKLTHSTKVVAMTMQS